MEEVGGVCGVGDGPVGWSCWFVWDARKGFGWARFGWACLVWACLNYLAGDWAGVVNWAGRFTWSGRVGWLGRWLGWATLALAAWALLGWLRFFDWPCQSGLLRQRGMALVGFGGA